MAVLRGHSATPGWSHAAARDAIATRQSHLGDTARHTADKPGSSSRSTAAVSTRDAGDRYAAPPTSIGQLHNGGTSGLRLLRRGTAAAISIVVALSPIGALTVAADGLAMDDPSYAVAEDQVLTVPVETGVLSNDTGGSLVLCVASVHTESLQGVLDLGGVSDGSFTYTPPPNFNGTTSFTYDVATIVGECPPPPVAEGTATVTITVAAVNDAPTAIGDSFTALKGHTLNIAAPGVLGNDSDVDGDPLTAVKKASPAHGAVTLAQDGAFSYTPDPGYVGSDQFAYWASDGTAHSPQRIVSLTVAALPPTPSPTPVVTPTPVPPTASPEPSPSESPEPSDSGLASPSPGASGIPSPSPSSGPVTGPVAGGGGPSIVALGALALLLSLLAVAAVFFIRSQRAGDDGEGQPGYLGGDFDDDEPPG